MRLRLDPSASLRMTWSVVRFLSLYVVPSVAPGIRRSVKITAATPGSFDFAQDDVVGCSFTITIRHSERSRGIQRGAKITAATPRSFGFAQDDVIGCSFTILIRRSERSPGNPAKRKNN